MIIIQRLLTQIPALHWEVGTLALLPSLQRFYPLADGYRRAIEAFKKLLKNEFYFWAFSVCLLPFFFFLAVKINYALFMFKSLETRLPGFLFSS